MHGGVLATCEVAVACFNAGMAGQRKAKLESFLKREIATTVSQELRDPRLGIITIARGELTPDFSRCTAYFTMLDGGAKLARAQDALDAATPYVQRAYAQHLKLRRVPELRFIFDEEEKRRQDMFELINKARATDPNEASSPDAE